MAELKIRAKLKKDIYRTDDYAVAIFEGTENGKTVEYKLVGSLIPQTKNVTYDITAEKKDDSKYSGFKYMVTSVSVSSTMDEDETISYLSSGIFQGIGKKTAERIYRTFGQDSVRIIEETPEELIKIKGLNRAKIDRMVEEYKKTTSLAALYKYLKPYGITFKQAGDIKKIVPDEYKKDLTNFAKEYPYDMIKVRGIKFDMADRVAIDNGFSTCHFERVSAAAREIIRNEMVKGHVACDYMTLATELIKILHTKEINAATVKKHILSLINSHRLEYKKAEYKNETYFYLYLPEVRRAEEELSDYIAKNTGISMTKIDALSARIKEEELKRGIKLDTSQEEAVKTALYNKFSIITGGPGTGKTTIIRMIADIWEKETKKGITLMSPTGKAARRMSECTKRPAATIHSTLKLGIDNREFASDGYDYADDEYIENNLVIIDECSMIGMFLARNTLKRLKHCQIVFVGDADQLPSVECGRVLADLIKSERIPVTKLEYTHRQDDGSSICTNAMRVNKGQAPLVAAADFQIRVFKDNDDNATGFYGADMERLGQVEEQMVKAYAENIKIFGKENVVLLCPFNKHYAGQISVNKKIQEMVNPSLGRKEYKGKDGNIFRTGDPVMQLINDDDIANGEVGVVTAIDKIDGRETLVVRFDECIKTYDKDTIENITLAYAMTVHKAQGSEYDAVITCLSDEHSVMLKRNILYTAITRAKKKVCLIGSEKAFATAINNDTIDERHTFLWYDLKQKIKNTNAQKEEKKENTGDGYAGQITLFDEGIITC